MDRENSQVVLNFRAGASNPGRAYRKVGQMPPLPPVPGVIRSTFKQTFQGDLDILNRCFWSFSGTTSQVSMGDFATALATHWHANIAPLQSNAMVLESVECVDLTSDSSPLAYAVPGTTGSLTPNPLAAGSAAIIQFEVNRRYRGGKPKIFVAGIMASQTQTVQTLTAAAIAAFEEAWLNIQAEVIETEFGSITTITGQVNVSYYSGFTNGTGPTGRAKVIPTLRETPVVDPIIGVGINPNIASQRRRNQTP